MRILIVEDDPIFAEVLQLSLAEQRYAVDVVSEGSQGFIYVLPPGERYDLIIIDVDLPNLDGITLCQQLRDHQIATPILLITAKGKETDRIRGLDQGADDYLVKPFSMDEFHARIRALRRRGEISAPPILRFGALQLDAAHRQVTYAQILLRLTPKEYGLLELLLRHPGRAFSRGEIVDHLWSFTDPPQEETVKSHIKGLRQKLRAVAATIRIENIYGMGYRLSQLEAEAFPQSASVHAAEGAMDIANPPVTTRVPTAAPVSDSPTPFKTRLDQLWLTYAPLIAERLHRLQAWSNAHSDNSLQTALRADAIGAAHQLAGVLGMFDREDETLVASEIESLLVSLAAEEDEGDSQRLLELTERTQHLIQHLCDRILPTLRTPMSAAPDPLTSTNGTAALAHYSSPFPPSDSLATAELPVGFNASPNWRVLVVDDDPIIIDTLRDCLAPWGMQVSGLLDSRQFWPTLHQVMPDLVILDIAMPHIDGITLCHEIRDSPDWQALPVIFLTRYQENPVVQQLFASGADDYVVKPIVREALVARIMNRLERLRLLQSFSRRDTVTGLDNYTQSSRLLQQLMDKHQLTYFLLLVCPDLRDLRINCGHGFTNQVLRQWGQWIHRQFPHPAVLGYWGEGEFVIGLGGQSYPEVYDRMIILLSDLQRRSLATPQGTNLHCSCAWAIAEYPRQGETLQALYQAASLRLRLASQELPA